MNYIVNAEWLKTKLNDPNVRIIDCRFDLSDENEGFEEYLKSHIPGAIYFDLNKDLSGVIKTHGGRHPLPELTEIQDKLSAAGIDESITVVAYDNEGSPFSARLLWLLNYLGHKKTFILNGGYKKWLEQDYPISSDIPVFERKPFKIEIQPDLLAEMEEVREKIHSLQTVIVDSRDSKRYHGIEEPIDPIGGHIPSAKNYFWKNVLSKNGNWKDVAELKDYFQNIPSDKEVIVYCGSGVTACPNYIALKEAGYLNVKLYLGSWSDWVSYRENIIEKSEE